MGRTHGDRRRRPERGRPSRGDAPPPAAGGGGWDPRGALGRPLSWGWGWGWRGSGTVPASPGRWGTGASGGEGSVRAVPAVTLRVGAKGAAGSADFGAGEARPAGSTPSAPAEPCRCPLCSGSSRYAGSVRPASPRAGPSATQGRLAEAGSPRGKSGVCAWQQWVSPKIRPRLFPGCRGHRLRDSLLYN